MCTLQRRVSKRLSFSLGEELGMENEHTTEEKDVPFLPRFIIFHIFSFLRRKVNFPIQLLLLYKLNILGSSKIFFGIKAVAQSGV